MLGEAALLLGIGAALRIGRALAGSPGAGSLGVTIQALGRDQQGDAWALAPVTPAICSARIALL